MIAFMIDLIFALLIGLSAVTTFINSKRGTNAVTRTVRDRTSFITYGKLVGVAMSWSILFLVIALCTSKTVSTPTFTTYSDNSHGYTQQTSTITTNKKITFGVPLYACIPTSVDVILILVFMGVSTRSQQRVRDAQYLQKAGIKAVKKAASTTKKVVTAPVVAAEKVITTPVRIAEKSAKAVDIVAGAVATEIVGETTARKVSDARDKIRKEWSSIDEKYTAGASQELLSSPAYSLDDKQFLAAASRSGIKIDGRPIDDIAADVVKYASPVMLQQLPAGLSVRDQALYIMEGRV